MKRILLVIASLCLLCVSDLYAQKTVTLRVMSMNIRQGGEYAGNKSEPYSELINKYQPDVVALQEVDYKTTRNGKRDWLNEVAMQTGMFPISANRLLIRAEDSEQRFFPNILSINVRRLFSHIRIQERTDRQDGFMSSSLVENL